MTHEEIAEYKRLGKPFDVTMLGLLKEAAERYPIGAKYKVLGSSGREVGGIAESSCEPSYFDLDEGDVLIEIGRGFCYVNGKWADVEEQTFQLDRWYQCKNDPKLFIKPVTITKKVNVDVIYSDGTYAHSFLTKSQFETWNLLEDLSIIQEHLPDGHPDKIVEVKRLFPKLPWKDEKKLIEIASKHDEKKLAVFINNAAHWSVNIYVQLTGIGSENKAKHVRQVLGLDKSVNAGIIWHQTKTENSNGYVMGVDTALDKAPLEILEEPKKSLVESTQLTLKKEKVSYKKTPTPKINKIKVSKKFL